jgi:hypothetical protein
MMLENIPINAVCIPAEYISEEPITNYTVLEMPKGFSLALFDMHIAENIGFEKFDILSQRHWSYR